MTGRRPRPGMGPARSGPASGTRRRAWPTAGRPEPPRAPDQPGSPGDPDVLAPADVLERAPGRWSPSGLGSPPRWLLAVIAVLVLAGGVTAFVASGLRHGQARPGRATAQVAVLPTACTYLIGPVSRAALANGMHETRQDAACARPGPGQAGSGGSGPGSSIICVGLQVTPGQHTSQFGIRHRCFPGLS